jgi:peptidoglycan/xylan/chitin deacetylase (PgdA/CDA1 family)
MKSDLNRRLTFSVFLMLLIGSISGFAVGLKSAEASGPWNGHMVAFTFTSDDGNKDNLVWADSVFIPRGLSYTAFIVSDQVNSDTLKLSDVDLNYLHDHGIEIGDHSKTHALLTEVSDDTLLIELVSSAIALEGFIQDPLYVVRTLAYPQHNHDLHVMAVAESVGYAAARDGGHNVLGYPWYSLGSNTWSSTSLYEVPLTVVYQYLVGDGNSYTETLTRAKVDTLLGLTYSKNVWINVYAHGLNEVDKDHMKWIIDEMQQGDVWIDNFGAVSDFYRVGHGLPVPIGVGLPTSVVLSRFQAVSRSDGILLTWAASGDADVSGFHVERSNAAKGSYVRLTPSLLVPSEGYEFLDRNVSPGITYFYRLEALSRTGGETFFGPVSARVEPGDGAGVGVVLGQAFPNPAQDSASTIPFSLSRPGSVSIQILDLSGRSVRTLVHAGMDAGDHAISWDGRDDRGDRVPPGIYLYRLQTPGFEATRKLLRL